MADIKPFKGYIYNKERVKDITKVLAPPYDVISPEMQDALCRRDSFNIVCLVLGKEKVEDSGAENKYKRAKASLDEWIEKKILVQDEIPCIYVYGQEYTVEGEKKNRIGFIALMKLEDPEESRALPHERTSQHPKKDRLKLIRKVRANLSPIFSIFEDEHSKITNILEKEAKKRPVFDVYYEEIRQRLWRIEDLKIMQDIKEAMAGKQIFIADGHHRYEVALTFRNEMRAKAKEALKEQPYDYVMMYFTSLDDAKLTILAIHRAIKDIGNLTREDVIRLVGKYFEVKKFTNYSDMRLTQEALSNKFAFGMYCGGTSFYLLELKDISGADKIIKTDKPIEWKRLDVTLLHRFILDRILKVEDKEDNIVYLKDAEKVVERVKNRDCKLGFFLNPTKLEQVKTIAQMGEKMPRKSTYFYPKLLSGIVINRFD